MIFTEFRFLLFFLVVFALYWMLRNNTARKTWLLITSYFFYGSWDWRFLSLILISTFVDYLAGKKIYQAQSRVKKRYWLTVSIITNIGILGFFKYYNFFIDSAIHFFAFLGISFNATSLNIILPVGISFYTFQTLSYSLDIYYEKLRPRESFLDLALFVAFFPQLVAGPIVRAKNFLPQLDSLKFFKDVDIRKYLLLFLCGFFKKAVVADNIAFFSDHLFRNPDIFSLPSVFLGVFAYAIQIYCDFSGYSDMALACAGLMGYQLPINFNFPYFSPNIQTFWKNWHISLSSWFMDYLYLPIAYSISRKIKQPKLAGIKAETWSYVGGIAGTMFLCGLWHGAAWSFVIWGGLHGFGLIFHRLWLKYIGKRKTPQKIFNVIGIPLTFYFTCIGWVIFRAADTATAVKILNSIVLFQPSGNANLNPSLLYIIILLTLAHLVTKKGIAQNFLFNLPAYAFSFIYGILFYFCNFFAQYSYKPFIYFQF